MINIVLYQPEIPPNTGNIIRTCYALGAKLHIIKPIAFDLFHPSIKRAGAGKELKMIEHEIYESYKDFNQKHSDKDIWYITRYSQNVYSSADLSTKDVWLMFGRESTGIPKEILSNNLERTLRIPMTSETRSLNLANCVAIVSYEVARQQNFKDLSTVEVQKGADWLKK